MNKRIRIKDIAERAGVSPGTVDRVLHRRGNVSKLVEERIRRVMKELNYRPNRIASTLAYNRTYRIASLLPDYRSDSYWTQPKKGLEQAFLDMQHYNLVWEPYYFQLHEPADFVKRAGELLRSAPDGMLIAPVFLEEGKWLLEECRNKNIPTVMINTYIDTEHYLCYVGQDSYRSGILAGRLLHFFLKPGETAMVLNLDKASAVAQHLLDKERGLRDYFSGQEVEVIQREFEAYDDADQLRAFMEDLFREKPRLRGIFVTNSRAYRLLDCLGDSFPPELRIVGFDLLEQNLRYLQEKKLAFLINQNPVHQGYQGIINLYTHLVLREEVRKMQYLPLDIIVTENAEYYLQREKEPQLVV